MPEPTDSPIGPEHDSPDEPLISSERSPERPPRAYWFVRFREWITRHKDEVQAWGTIVTAGTAFVLLIITTVSVVLTNRSLEEVQKQRELVREQFVIVNAPSVRASVTKGFQFRDERAVLDGKVVNAGGPVHDVTITSLVLCCGLAELRERPLTKVIRNSTSKHRVNRAEEFTVPIKVDDPEELAWLKSAAAGVGKMYVYVRVEYTIPAELTLDGRAKPDETFALVVWDARSKAFDGVIPQASTIVLDLIKQHGYFADLTR